MNKCEVEINMKRMNRIFYFFALLAVVAGCSRVPITNRKQLNMLPEKELIGMADSQYRQVLTTSKVLPLNDPRATRVSKVGVKIKDAVVTFLTKKGLTARMDGFGWEFNTIDEKVVNAWCMPGGKVVVYTEILKLATTDDELAVIMGHEIAHAIARHGNERMSQAMAVQGLGSTLGAVMGDNPNTGQSIFLQAYGVGSVLGILGYSRKHETEADKLGLVFMKLAGYNPTAAIGFWKKMSELGSGQAPPEIFSTHPSDEKRIKDIEAFIPEIDKHTN